MVTFSLNLMEESNSSAYSVKVLNALKGLEGYFRMFSPNNYKDVMHNAYILALEHRNDSYDDIAPYLKKLARTVSIDRSPEKAYDMSSENGEVAPVFRGLIEEQDVSLLIDGEDVRNALYDLYLEYPKQMMSIKPFILKGQDTLSDEFKKENHRFVKMFLDIMRRHKGTIIYNLMIELYNKIDQRQTESIPQGIKIITIKEANYTNVDKITDKPLIYNNKGEYGVCKLSLLTQGINPDFTDWSVISGNQNVVKVDLQNYFNYVYESLYVDVGVNTPTIEWFGTRYKVTAPSGYTMLNIDRDNFLELVHKELIINLLMNGFLGVVAISKDFLYLKESKRIGFNTVRCKLASGRIIDLPILRHRTRT